MSSVVGVLLDLICLIKEKNLEPFLPSLAHQQYRNYEPLTEQMY